MNVSAVKHKGMLMGRCVYVPGLEPSIYVISLCGGVVRSEQCSEWEHASDLHGDTNIFNIFYPSHHLLIVFASLTRCFPVKSPQG